MFLVLGLLIRGWDLKILNQRIKKLIYLRGKRKDSAKEPGLKFMLLDSLIFYIEAIIFLK